MTHRPLRTSDIPILQEYARISGFPYPELDHPHIEAVEVITDETGEIIIGVVAKRLVEIYLYIDPERSPAVKMDALKLAHSAMAVKLSTLGYQSAESFLPPNVSDRFGRRLERTFGWVRNQWKSWTIRF